jgi:hypothetical protein
MRAVLSALPVLAGLVLLDHVLRQRVTDGTAFWTVVLAAYATPLFPLLAHATPPVYPLVTHMADGPRAIAFLSGAVACMLVPRWSASSWARRVGFGLALAGGLLLDVRVPAPTLDLYRALFGSREGLLFWTPLLWGSLGGAAVLYRREGREAAHLAGIAVLPFAAAAYLDRAYVALPAMLVALGVALEFLSRLVQRRPSWALAATLPIVAASNLLFMEQYRHTLKRDDTVSFPQVSEGNARLLAEAVGSPIAWPANWAWSARTGLPVERWDLLSGHRLDPARGVTIDVGDIDQDAAFLLGGWSVRHVCGTAICRDVEGPAEVILPLEREAASLTLRAQGPGAVHVTVNGADAGALALGQDVLPLTIPGARLRQGLNRIGLSAAPGATVRVDAVAVAGTER